MLLYKGIEMKNTTALEENTEQEKKGESDNMIRLLTCFGIEVKEVFSNEQYTSCKWQDGTSTIWYKQ